MDIKVLLQAFNAPWMIHPEQAQYYALIAHRIFAGDTNIAEQAEKQPVEFAYVVNAAGKKIATIQDAVDNGVAVINLKGAVMKYDYCGAAGTQSLISAITAANENPAIAAIVLQVDSPGGSVDGTEQMANAVKNSGKPIVAYINGMMCSAAMWIGSAASMRIASSKTDTIGSIGTMASWSDYSGYLEKLGVKQHEVYATNSTHKNLPFREANGKNEAGSSNYEPLVKTWLDPLNNVFQETISENLPDADKSVFNGSAYIATTARQKGLIDKIGTFKDAVNQALKLANAQQASAQIQTQNTTMKWTKFLAFIGFTGAIASAKDITLEDTQADSIEAALAENETLKANLQTASDQLTAMTAERDNSQAALTAAQATIARLEKQDATTASAPVAEKDSNPTATVDAANMDFQQELFAKL
jgi:signal peptide peptidase SppA